MNLGFSSFRVCRLRLKTRIRPILLLATFRFGSSLLHLMMMLRARCEPTFWACKFHWNFLCTLDVCASNFSLDSLFESSCNTSYSLSKELVVRACYVKGSWLLDRFRVVKVFLSCESLSSVVWAWMLDELNCLLFLCIIARQAWLFMCIVVGRIGTYVNKNQ
jgi:hypothetical protein